MDTWRHSGNEFDDGGGQSIKNRRSRNENQTGKVPKNFIKRSQNLFSVDPIYAYDQGLTRIPDGTESDIIERSFQQGWSNIKFLEDRGDYIDVTPLIDTVTNIVLGNDQSFPLRTLVYKYRVTTTTEAGTEKSPLNEIQSQLHLTAKKDHLFKIRATYSAEFAEAGNAEVTRFLKTVFEKLDE